MAKDKEIQKLYKEKQKIEAKEMKQTTHIAQNVLMRFALKDVTDHITKN